MTRRHLDVFIHGIYQTALEKVGRNQMKGPVRLSLVSSRRPQGCRQGQMPGKEDPERHTSGPWRLSGEGPAGRCLPQILRTLGVEVAVPFHIPLLVGIELPARSLVGPCLEPRCSWGRGGGGGPGSSPLREDLPAHSQLCVSLWKQPCPFYWL